MEENEEILNEQPISEEEVSETAEQITENTSLEDQLAELNDKYLRTAAELENTRRRAALDSESAARNRAVGIAEKFLPLIDAIDAAAAHAPDDEGAKVLAAAAASVLDSVGIMKIKSLGEALNPQLHNAIQIVPNSGAAANTIVNQLQAGYKFGETILRPAMVAVAG